MNKFMKLMTIFLPVLAFAKLAMGAEGGEAAATGTPLIWYIAPVSSILSLVFAVYFYKKMMSAPEGNDTMIEIATHVREGAYAGCV